MGKLTSSQRNELRDYLIRQGVSFKPLQDEMVDHISCDLEDRMSQGYSFPEAWRQSMDELPDNHFQSIQTEIMETINKRFNLSQTLSFLALALFFVSTTFKILRFPLSGEILLLSFGAIAASLLTTSLTGISLNKGKKGSLRLLSMIGAIIIFITGFSFRVLHLPGADQLILLAIGLLILSLTANAIYVYRHASGEGNLLTFLHQKYTPGIERFSLLLLIPLAIYKVVSILNDSADFAGNMILLVVIFGAGLQFIALCWRTMETDISRRNPFTLTAVLISGFCLTIVFLGPLLPLSLRIVLIALYSATSGWLAFRMESEPRKMKRIDLSSACPGCIPGMGTREAQFNAVVHRSPFFQHPGVDAPADRFVPVPEGRHHAHLHARLGRLLFV